MTRKRQELVLDRGVLDRALHKMYGDTIEITDDPSRLRIIREFNAGGLTRGLEGLRIDEERLALAAFVTYNAGYFAGWDDFRAAIRLAGREAVLLLLAERTQTLADADQLLGLLIRGSELEVSQTTAIMALAEANDRVHSAGVRAQIDRWIEWVKKEGFLSGLDTVLIDIPHALLAEVCTPLASTVAELSSERLKQALEQQHIGVALVICHGFSVPMLERLGTEMVQAAQEVIDTYAS